MVGRGSCGIVWAIMCASCSAPPPPAPAAIVNVTPGSVCIGDNFQTQVHVDSRGSSPKLTLVYSPPDSDAGDLIFAWRFSGAVCQGTLGGAAMTLGGAPCSSYDVLLDPSGVDALGNVNNSDVLLRIAGDRPVFVALQVTNAAGGVTETETAIPITALDDAGACPLTQGP
jgi:hypothetical protein